MLKKYYNLKVADYNFDYARGERYEIKGEVVELPASVGDKFPHLFKPVNQVVTTENETELEEDEQVVTTENETELEEDEQVVTEEPELEKEMSLVEQFEKGLENGEVSRGSKFFSWNGRRGLISAWESLETEEEKEAFIQESFLS